MSTFEQMTLQGLVRNEKHSIKRGPFGGSLKKNIFVPSGYKVYEQQHVIQNDFNLGRYFITEQKYKEMEGFSVCPGDFLISCSGTIGKIAIVPDDVKKGIINQALLKISLDHHKILPNYFKYLFESDLIQKRLTKISRGVAIKNVPSVKELKEISFPVPSVDLQIKILQCIETQLTRLNAVTKTLKVIQAKLGIYRKSVLKAAFNGQRLIDCEIKTLGDLERKGGGTPSTKIKEYWGGNINWITSASIDDKNNITFKKKITNFGLKNSAANLVPKGSVIVVTRVGLGKVAVNEEPTTFSQDCQGIICKDINPYFLMWQIKSAANEIIHQGQGTTISGVTVNKLNLIEIKVPDIDAQIEIVNQIESRFSVIDKLEEVVGASLVKTEKLHKSILKSAFEGKLVN